jgi:hypothetical protein
LASATTAMNVPIPNRRLVSIVDNPEIIDRIPLEGDDFLSCLLALSVSLLLSI